MAVRTSSNYKEGLKCLGAFLGDVGCQDLLKPPAANAPQAPPADLDGAQLAGTVRATVLRSGPLGGRTVAKRETGKKSTKFPRLRKTANPIPGGRPARRSQRSRLPPCR